MKASDVDDVAFLTIVDRRSKDRSYGTAHRWVLRGEVEEEMSDVPWKVLLAKARSLKKRGLLDGCMCGCRGDYELTAAGREVVGSAP